jgi:hypothetical protein
MTWRWPWSRRRKVELVPADEIAILQAIVLAAASGFVHSSQTTVVGPYGAPGFNFDFSQPRTQAALVELVNAVMRYEAAE